jgi:hypothetical protein
MVSGFLKENKSTETSEKKITFFMSKRLFTLVVKKQNPLTGMDEKFTGAELLDMALFEKALKGDVLAYREIMDRAEGKVSTQIEVGTNNPKKEPITEIRVIHSLIEDHTQIIKTC